MAATTFNLADLFESIVDVIPDKVGLVSGKNRMTYKQIDERANRLANFWKDQGVKAGDHIGLYAFNGNEFVEAFIAAFKIRAVPVNINYRYVAEELKYLCDNGDIKVLVHMRESTPMIAEVKDQLKSVTTYLAIDDGSGIDASTIGSFDYEKALAAGSPERKFDKRSSDDQYIIYTGGTTGMPRGVMWRCEDIFYAGLQGGNPGGEKHERPEQVAAHALSGDGALTFLPAAPLIHGAAQFAVWICFFTGGKVVLQPGKSFDPKRVLELIGEEGVSTVTLVGDAMARPLVEGYADAKDKYDVSTWMVMASAGAILSDAIKDRFAEHLPDLMVINSFGASEAGHTGSVVPNNRTDGAKSFVMDETCTVLDDDGKQIVPGSGKIGKLARRGNIPLGYYKDPEKTAATFPTVNGMRYVVPGDMATIEEDGTFTVFGRGAVCINSGGEKIFPEEVEEVLKGHADVMDAVVVGVPDERWGQRVAALVKLRSGEARIDEDLKSFCRNKLAGYKVPREWHFVKDMNRQPSGKPDYRWAKDTAIAMAAASAKV